MVESGVVPMYDGKRHQTPLVHFCYSNRISMAVPLHKKVDEFDDIPTRNTNVLIHRILVNVEISIFEVDPHTMIVKVAVKVHKCRSIMPGEFCIMGGYCQSQNFVVGFRVIIAEIFGFSKDAAHGISREIIRGAGNQHKNHLLEHPMMNVIYAITSSISCGLLLYFLEKLSKQETLISRLENRIDSLEEQVRKLDACIDSLSPTPPAVHDRDGHAEILAKTDLLYNLSPMTVASAGF